MILRMRQAETALKDGRLDEAFEIVRQGEMREHRRGQELVGRLARALCSRGEEHLAAGRLTEASADADRAATLGGGLPEVASLKSAVTQAAAVRQQQERRRAGRIAAVREHLYGGELSIGQGLLDNLDETYRAEMLKDEAAVRRAKAEKCVAQAAEAIEREDWPRGVEAIVKARELHATNGRLTDLAAALTIGVVDRLREAMRQGRLDQARYYVEVAGPVCGDAMAFVELSRVLDLAGKAAVATQQARWRTALEYLHRVRTVLPDAAWVAEALGDAELAATSAERLRGGPLGLLAGDSTDDPSQDVAGFGPRVAADETAAVPKERAKVRKPPAPVRASAGALPPRFMLNVDGVGSFLVVRERCATIAAASASRRPDVPLMLDASATPVMIERDDEDYFVATGTNAKGDAIGRRLLHDGERIGITQRCHARFTRPNAASTSAVLSIAGARIPATDATRVILLDRSLVIGPGSSAHVRADALAAPVVLHVRDGRLFCNASEEVTVNDKPMDRQVGLPTDARVRIGPVTLTIRPA